MCETWPVSSFRVSRVVCDPADWLFRISSYISHLEEVKQTLSGGSCFLGYLGLNGSKILSSLKYCWALQALFCTIYLKLLNLHFLLTPKKWRHLPFNWMQITWPPFFSWTIELKILCTRGSCYFEGHVSLWVDKWFRGLVHFKWFFVAYGGSYWGSTKTELRFSINPRRIFLS